MIRSLALFALSALLVVPLRAADAYILQFHANDTVNGLAWGSDVLFFNGNASPVTVRLLGASSGATITGTAVTVPPHQTTSPYSVNAWHYVGEDGLTVLHLDIPRGMLVQSRNIFMRSYGIPELLPTPLGDVTMPVFHELTEPNVPQVHLGADLSGEPTRINVVIYNAGERTATANVEVRRTCDDAVMDTRTLAVPANTVVQEVGFDPGSDSCTSWSSAQTNPGVRSVLVTVDQPSLSFVSVLVPGTIPLTTIGMSTNASF